MTGRQIYALTMADVLAIAADAVGPYQVRDAGLMASALHRAQTAVFGVDPYPTVLEKAAVLLHSLARNHPLLDGNKRLAIASAMVFLARNEVDIDLLDEDKAYDLTMAVAKGELDDISEIAERLVDVLGL